MYLWTGWIGPSQNEVSSLRANLLRHSHLPKSAACAHRGRIYSLNRGARTKFGWRHSRSKSMDPRCMDGCLWVGMQRQTHMIRNTRSVGNMGSAINLLEGL